MKKSNQPIIPSCNKEIKAPVEIYAKQPAQPAGVPFGSPSIVSTARKSKRQLLVSHPASSVLFLELEQLNGGDHKLLRVAVIHG